MNTKGWQTPHHLNIQKLGVNLGLTLVLLVKLQYLARLRLGTVLVRVWQEALHVDGLRGVLVLSVVSVVDLEDHGGQVTSNVNADRMFSNLDSIPCLLIQHVQLNRITRTWSKHCI